MKIRNILWLVLVSCTLFAACTGNDDDLGEILPVMPEYELPQGKSPADDRIVEYYNNYGSYILYEYVELDFMRDIDATGYVYELPDPQYVGDMLDFLEDTWFDFYPAEFHKQFMPYKIFLTQKLQNVSAGFPSNMFILRRSWKSRIHGKLCFGVICGIVRWKFRKNSLV